MGTKKDVSPIIKKVLVTGGGGFVGKAIVRMLLDSGVSCTVIGRNHYPEVEAMGAKCLVGDISDLDTIVDATKNMDTVFHVAALAGIWGPWKQYYKINVVGTRNVIKGCLKNGIPRLVYTSTPSVVFKKDDICEGDETLAYADRFLCNYAKSKVLAEKDVLAANCEKLVTCAIRPHLIWGPGDPHLIPRLIDSGKKKKLKIVGSGKNRVDVTYIDNVAFAHILAANNLSTVKSAAGKAYFIGQEEPVELWSWINSLFHRLGIPVVKSSVSFPAAYVIGGIWEIVSKILRHDNEPQMTRFLALQLSKSHYFSHNNAQTDLGYQPIVSTEAGLDHLEQWLKSYENDNT